MPTTQMDVREISVPATDGLSLKARWWSRPRPRGVLVVAHGFGEHGGAYSHVAEAVGASLEIDVLAFDFRGHGRSPGRRGVVRHYGELVEDLRAAVTWVGMRMPGLPLFVLGHSNGGQVVLRFALTDSDSVAGVIASNPSIRIALRVPATKLKLGRLLHLLAPWITLKADAPSTWMTRDPAMQETYRADGLRHNRISAPLFFGMIEGGEMLLTRASEIQTPILMIVGGQDPVVNPETTRRFFELISSHDKTLMLYPKMLHEPLNEIGKEQVFDDLTRWLAPRLDAHVQSR